jgi:hypothetical protein
VESQRSHRDEGFDPDWITYAFTAWARCSVAACKQEFAISGRGGVTQEVTSEDGDWDWVEFFEPRHCYPMPHIIAIPKQCPGNVALELESAFSLFWSSPAACAGRIRVALELLMDQLGVPKRKKSSKGGLYDLPLHDRLEHFSVKAPAVAQHLMALKVLGNAGSHVAEVKQVDLLDAFEILEHALGEIVDRRTARIAELTQSLLKKHRRKK